ncbi:MAG: SMP-30/gluconolactonase/LRE family protein [Chloroflexota bacterium]|nr:MAG: SMP-30/gluconolactonase/LRE family protein [Chloroflexota bacterium]
MEEVEHVLRVRCELGEGPVWRPDEQALYWTDILCKQIHRYEPGKGKHDVYETGLPVGSFAFRSRGDFLVAAGNMLAYWRPGSYGVEVLHVFDEFSRDDRLNDGKVDSSGCFWTGSMCSGGGGHLYRLDVDGSIRVMESGIGISNGLGWSPDNLRMYYTDTMAHTIYVYDYDASRGTISNRRTFVHVPEELGYPDGVAVDEQGFVWSAMWAGWKVIRFAPDGSVDRIVQMPVDKPTSCAFGGPGLDELYITSAHRYRDTDQRSAQTLAGDLFRVKAGVRGTPVQPFGG